MKNKYDIEEWVATRSFDQLADAEKAIVIEELGSDDAYREMRKIVLSLLEDEVVAAPDAMRKNIMDAFDAHHGSEQKIIPFRKSKSYGAKKVLVYALLAASIIVAVFLILPDRNSGSNLQIAENKNKKEMISDSATRQQNLKNDMEKFAPKANDKNEQQSKTEPGVSDLRSGTANKEYIPESESPNISNENSQTYSSKAEKKYEPDKNIAEVAEDVDLEATDLSKDEIAAPPQPVQEMSFDQENEGFSKQQRAISAESLSKRKGIPVFTFKVENFTQNHYTSY